MHNRISGCVSVSFQQLLSCTYSKQFSPGDELFKVWLLKIPGKVTTSTHRLTSLNKVGQKTKQKHTRSPFDDVIELFVDSSLGCVSV